MIRNRYIRANCSSSEIGTDTGGNQTTFSPVIEMKNTSSIRLEKGYIVKLDEMVPFAVTTFPPFQSFQIKPFGVIKKAGDPNEQVEVIFFGVCEIVIDTYPVNIGDFIYTSQTVGHGTANSSFFIGAIGRALEIKSSGVQKSIKVLIHPFGG